MLTLDDIREAAARIAPFVHTTPVLSSSAINRMTGAEVFFKCENFQKVGAFKIRGAVNAVGRISEDDAGRGVATHSSGNHAAAVALAASTRNVPAFTVMPRTAPAVKKQAVAGYGAEIIFCGPTLADRDKVVNQVIERTGAHFVHPYDNLDVIAGQATVALEFLQQAPDLDVVMAPIGGGGLISGTALTVAGLTPDIEVVGAEPAGADDAYRSFGSGALTTIANPSSIADGLLASLSEQTFQIISRHVSDIITVDDESIVRAMRIIWERMKIVVEPSAAVPFAALLSARQYAGRRVGIILSGGNVDLDALPWRGQPETAA